MKKINHNYDSIKGFYGKLHTPTPTKNPHPQMITRPYQHTDIQSSGVTGGGGGPGGQSAPPETSDREIFADVSGKKRQGKKGKGVKIEKKRWKIGNGSRK